MAEVLRLDVADVQEAVAADAEVDEGRLDARLQVDHHPLVDVADVVVLPGPLDVQLFQNSVFNDRDPAFFRLRDVDQHFLLHDLAFLAGKVGELRRGAHRSCGEALADRESVAEASFMAQLHGGAGQVKALADSRSANSSAASTSRGPALGLRVDASSRIWSTPCLERKRLQEAAQVDGRLPLGPLTTGYDAAHEPRRAVGRLRGASGGGNRHLVGSAAEPGFARTSGGRTSTPKERQPRRRGAAKPRSSSSALCRLGQLQFHHFVQSFDSHGQGRGKARSAAWDEIPRSSPEPARRGGTAAPCERARSRWPDQAQVALLAKANTHSLSNHRFALPRRCR